MPRLLPPILVLILAASAAVAGDREDFESARDALLDAYFDELAPEKRDELFAALGRWDDRAVVKPIVNIASRFGTYLSGIESQISATQGKISPLQSRGALSRDQAAERDGHIAGIEGKEKEWRRALVSQRLLAQTLASYRQPKTVQEALKVMVKHPTGRVRQLLAMAAGPWHKQLKDAGLSGKLMAALERLQTDDELDVRMEVARALTHFHSREGIEQLAKSLRDGDWRVRAEAIRLLAAIATDEAVGALIDHMPAESGRLANDIERVLEKITGRRFAFADAWGRWWKSVKRTLPPKPTGDAATKAAQRRLDDAEFYGIPIPSDRICFVIDVSGSMKKKVEQVHKTRAAVTGKRDKQSPVLGKTRLEVAQNALKRAIHNLHSSKQFSIIFFSHAVKVWRDEMTQATPDNKKAAAKAIEAVAARGSTYTQGALREAFTMAGAIARKQKSKRDGAGIDTIFLLSDGGPTNNSIEEPKPVEADDVLGAVEEWNRNVGIVIHVIAVDTEEVGTYFLKNLAAQNGGIFVER